jgi:nucleotide-binding universal stress UspA family protein
MLSSVAVRLRLTALPGHCVDPSCTTTVTREERMQGASTHGSTAAGGPGTSLAAGPQGSLAELTGALTQGRRPLDLSGRAIIVATDGSEGSAGAVRMAAALAERHRAVVHAVTVVDTRRAPMPPGLDLAIAIGDTLVGPAVHEDRVHDIRITLEAAIGTPIDWPVRVMLDAPAVAIAKEARRVRAVLIIVGLRRHGRLERAVHDETVLALMRHASCPVLGVVPDATRLPRRVLVAVDFSETSLIAARSAAAVAAADATVVLAYVPPLAEYSSDDGERLVHDLGVEAAFARTAQELAQDGIRFDHVVLHRQRPGSPSELLLEYADGASTELVAAGSARHGRVERWMLGSVSTELVRDGRQSILIVPPRESGAR